MNFCFLALLFLSLPSWAKDLGNFSGNVEAQARHSWNNDLANDLFQDWDEEDFYLLYGNLNSKFDSGNSRVESNVFARYSKSPLYRERPAPFPPYVAPLIFTFPNKLVAREVFKLTHDERADDHREELVLNKLYYQWSSDDNRFMIGRMYINYGQGEIFNPINPFNQPTGLTSVSQVAQGNDGVNFTFFVNDHHTLDFFFLGDKSFDNFNGEIERTLWIHGEYQVSDSLQFDYVAGQDQNRNKLGGQVRRSFEEATVFVQTLYQSDFTNDVESHPLWDAMLGYDQQVTSKWHVRIEAGYQKSNRFINLDNSLNERFLPTEYFVAFANQYEIHPLVKLTGTIVNDVKSGFTYFITRNTFDLGHDTEAEIFGYLPAAKGSDIENPAQKLVTTDVGVALRTFF